MELLENIRFKAKSYNKCIVLPEGTEERTLQAADEILGRKLPGSFFLGRKRRLTGFVGNLNLQILIKQPL